MPRLPFDLKVCEKQYTGKSVYRFRLRWDNYKEGDRKFLKGEEIKQNLCMSTFCHQSFEEDVSICLIDKSDPYDPHKREYWIWILDEDS